MAEKIFLPDVPAALAAHGITASYHQVWMQVIRGGARHERVYGRVMVEADDLPLLAAALKSKSDKNLAKAAGL